MPEGAKDVATGKVREVTGPEFEELIAGGRPVLAYFYGTWCGSCRALEPVVERLAERFAGRVDFVKVNTDRNPALAGKHGVISLPTFLLAAGGRAEGRLVGTGSENALAALIDPYTGGGKG